LPLIEWIEEQYANSEDLVSLAKVAKETHRRLEHLIDEIKAFVRGEHESCCMEEIPLDKLIREVVSFARFDKSIPEGSVRVHVRSQPVIRADRLKLQLVLLNLLKNAGDAVQAQPEPAITVSLEQRDAEAILRVIDNGCGIPEDDLKKIWDPFFTTKGADGTGLGLDTTRRIVELHQGYVACSSEAGCGSDFAIRLPVLSESQDLPPP
jgi:signal transduction histidine kinase